jgi:hypothetical protein
MTFVGDDFLVRTIADVFIVPEYHSGPRPFPAGASVNLSGVWLGYAGPVPDSGGAIVNGVHYPFVYFVYPSGGTFTAPSVTLTGEGLRIFTVPFTFNGVVKAFDIQSPSPDDQPLFTATLVGGGTARAAFFGFEGPFGPIFDPITLPGRDHQLEYVFSPSKPVPEPGTLVLLATGAVGMVAARRRSRRRAAQAQRSRELASQPN